MKSYCGIDCEVCEAYIATRTRNQQLKQRVARKWTEFYGRNIGVEEVDCRGCRSGGANGIFCRTLCQVKPCCAKQRLENCGECPAFPCEKLEAILAHFPEARHRLEAHRLMHGGRCQRDL